MGELYISGTQWGTGSGSQSLANLTFVARLNAQGVCQWVRYQGPLNSPRLAADPSTGGVVVVGQYDSSTPALGNMPLPNPGNSTALYVARLNPAGQVTAVATTTGSNVRMNINGLDVGPTGQVLVCGSKSSGPFSFGSHTLTSSNDLAFVVAQLSSTNQWDWALTSTSNAGSSLATAVRYSPAGVWVSGTGYNGAVVGPVMLTPVASGIGGPHASFLGRLSGSGQWELVNTATPDASGGADLTLTGIDPLGNAVALGSLRSGGNLTLGSQTLTPTASQLLYFTARLASTGQWFNVTPMPLVSNGQWLVNAGTLDAANNFYLTGSLEGNLTLGTHQLQGSGLAAGSSGPIRWPCGDVVLAQLNDGAPLTSRPAADQPTVTCFPNPAHGRATVRLSAAAAVPQPLTVLDALGRPVRRTVLPAHSTELALDLTGLAPGVYALRLEREGQPMMQRLVVE